MNRTVWNVSAAVGASLLLVSSLARAEGAFKDVWSQVKSDPYASLPQYEVTKASFYDGAVNMLKKSVDRTLVTEDDILPRFQKFVHPTGICFAGTWSITEASPYTGYFAKGSEGLIIVRASEAMGNTKVGDWRAFGFAGKLFPTKDRQDTTVTPTASFFTADDLGGTHAKSFLDLAKTNNPKTSFHLSSVLILATIADIAKTISSGDQNPTIRQVYPIAELGLAEGTTARAPKWFMVQAENTERNGAKDFRDELRLKNFPNGLTFSILVSEEGDTKWTKLGQIKLDEEALTDSCDHRLHFHHPKFK